MGKYDYVKEWTKENYEKITVYVKKGEREKIKAKANTMNISVNEMIRRLIENADGL